MSAHGSAYLENEKTTPADLSDGLSVKESGILAFLPRPRVREWELWKSKQAQAGLGGGNTSFHQPAQLFSVSALLEARQGLYLNLLCIIQGKKKPFLERVEVGGICLSHGV